MVPQPHVSRRPICQHSFPVCRSVSLPEIHQLRGVWLYPHSQLDTAQVVVERTGVGLATDDVRLNLRQPPQLYQALGRGFYVRRGILMVKGRKLGPGGLYCLSKLGEALGINFSG